MQTAKGGKAGSSRGSGVELRSVSVEAEQAYMV